MSVLLPDKAMGLGLFLKRISIFCFPLQERVIESYYRVTPRWQGKGANSAPDPNSERRSEVGL